MRMSTTQFVLLTGIVGLVGWSVYRVLKTDCCGAAQKHRDHDKYYAPGAHREPNLDDELEDSFPASDPPSFTPVTSTGGPASV